MRAPSLRVSMLIADIVLLAAVAVGVVVAVNHDGRSPMERLEDKLVQRRAKGIRQVSLATCPRATLASGEHFQDLHRDAESDVVVPRGATEVLLCRYYGYGLTLRDVGRAETLAATVRLGRLPVVNSIVRQFDQLEHLPENGEYTCPEDDGSKLYAFFGYADEPPVPVFADLSGCQFGGSPNGPGIGFSTEIIRRLERLTSQGRRP